MERSTAAGLMALAAIASPIRPVLAQEQSNATIDEWTVPWPGTRPRDPYLGPDGAVWFVGQTGDYIAALDPGTGEYRRFELEDGAGPHNLIVGDDGIVWYAGNRASHIGRLDPLTGAIDKIMMPDPAVRDPHTLVFDHRGHIWFTAQQSNFVGRLTIATREVELMRVPTPGARPYGIVIDADGRPWIAEFGSNRLATVDPRTMALEEIELPRENARPRRLALTSGGDVFYVDYVGGFVGRYSPASRSFSEWPSPRGAASLPYGMTIDSQDRIWYVETNQPNRLIGFDTRSEEFIRVTDLPSGGLTVRHMFYDPDTDTVWFGTDANTIGRFVLARAAGAV